MYVEFNESENPERDWEISAEFYPEERKELDFYITATREKQVCPEVPRQEKPRETRSRQARSCQRIHQRMLRHASHKASVHQG